MNLYDKPPLDELYHYGMPKRSGRYPYGSGENPYQHSGDFLSRIEELKKDGLSDTDIAKSMGMTTTQFRTQRSIAKSERRANQVATARGLKEKGYGATEIGKKMGLNESTVRSLLNEQSEAKMNQATTTANFLRDRVDEKGMIDVGVGVERELGVSREKLKQSLEILKNEGYNVYKGGVPQVTNPGKQTNLQVLCKPGIEHKEIYNYENVHSVRDYISYDDGETFKKSFVYPKSMDSSRMMVRYAEDGGTERDGMVEIRRGVDDLSLGKSNYAQVRILVDDTHYIKGMAVYNDNMPDGVDVIFNTNKKAGTPVHDVLKKIKDDPDNPFGSLIKEHGGQSYYTDKDGKEQLSLINKRAEEGDWDEWADKLPSQFLSKQNMQMIEKQLNLTAADKYAEYDEICNLTNPTVKKNMLKTFSEDCDAAAVHLKAAALPRQRFQVILPVPSLKDNEIYAPNFEDGEKVALIRYPHGGTFEIPILTVNNKHKDSRKMIGTNALDAVGINSKVAERLSGADFDGDTVQVIPTRGNGKNLNVNVTSTPPLKGLEGFDPKMEYGGKPEGSFKQMKNTGTEMGKISNLITDMTLQGASQDELARAVRHSMVVIDAEKHKLDYKQSEIDNGIASLKKKYQKHDDDEKSGGAATLISRAKSQQSVLKRQGSPSIDKHTGKLIYKVADDVEYSYEKINKRTGEITTVTKQKMQRSTKMAETDDAYSLVSKANTPQERAYAEYANKMKALANQARKEILVAGKIEYSREANQTYKKEVDSLYSKLNISAKNAPRERQAQTIANAEIKAKVQDNPDMTKKEIKKASQQALTRARIKVGAERKYIELTDREWEAIQAGAISESKLNDILRYVKDEDIRMRATPRATNTISEAKANQIQNMANSGYTNEQIAKRLGVSSSTVIKYMK